MKKSKADLVASNAKAMAAVDKYLSNIGPMTFDGTSYTPASLKAVFQADTDAINAADAQHTQWKQLLLTVALTHKNVAAMRRWLRGFVLSFFGSQAPAVLGDFGLPTPKARTAKSVVTKAVAVAKMRATRKARHTLGSKQKQEIKGTVDVPAIVEALQNQGTPAPAPPEPAPVPPVPAPAGAQPAAGGATTK